MVKVQEIKIDGEGLHVFNSAIYIIESSTGYTLQLDAVVSEVVVLKYQNEETLLVEIELQDGRQITSFMHLKRLSGGLPQLNLFCELNDIDDFHDFLMINENDSSYPNVEDGITLEEIRKYEMPSEKITLKLKLPIEQTEWLSEQKTGDLSNIIKEAIYDYWRKYEMK
ncbi:hypothetical protein [Metabacillus niabensis]|uniref:Uncharacterized protein n=1 Tax=Metabacillus niabensis TaxID=324854 RepID=A0ABT9Z3H4_9BACI|nr:hypothetical protein [Metabacillus niabensis]MDQ0226357.1 hypothetical protein [Metabacillus niabensis]